MTTVRRFAETLLCFSLLLFVSDCGRAPRLTTQSPEALRAYQEGLGQYEKFYYREAKASFEEALRIDSTFSMAWTRMAMVNWASRDEEQARRDIARAMQLATHATEREQLFIRAWSQVLNFNTNGALATVDSLVTRYPDEKEGYLLRGNLYENNKNLEAAKQSYQQAINVDTAYAQAVMSLGYLYSTTGEPEKAAVQMQKYIRLAPEAADPRASYADILVRVGRYDEALEQYRKSLELKPDYWYAIREIGNIYMAMGRLKEAEEQFHASLKLLPQNRQVEATHAQQDGLLDFYRGKYEEAVRLFNEALRIDSNSLDAAAGSVNALGKLKKFAEADQVLGRIREEFRRRNLGESPVMLGYHLIRSRLLTEQGDLGPALAECDSALGFSTVISRPAVYRQMAEIYRRQKSFEPALDACEQALSVNPNAPEALLTLMRIYHDRGDRRMTREIGNRLMTFWAKADPDYQNRIDLMKLLGVTS
jgi:tetratricopeptide (TPR) repeat protein